MEVEFRNKKLEKNLTDLRKLNKKYGQMARKINQRISELRSVESLADMGKIPGAKCHELKDAREGELSVKITKNYRLIFEPNHSKIPEKEDGGLDWSKVIKVKILEITDYH